MTAHVYSTGIDIGSTTIKIAVYDESSSLLYYNYCRHHTLTIATVSEILSDLRSKLGSIDIDVAFTGSAGIGIAETFEMPFVQEVVVAARYIRNMAPEVRTYLEIGGEDAKIVLIDDEFRPQIRMNGSCAGGTGAFIEQMSMLLNVSLDDLNKLAQKSSNIYPIASRCGVFAKTDIQSLLSNRVAKEDIAASIFHAVALQVLASLGKGSAMKRKVLFAGGPLTFFSALRNAFIRILHLNPDNDIAYCPHPELVAASGAALYRGNIHKVLNIDLLQRSLVQERGKDAGYRKQQLSPLFISKREIIEWENRHNKYLLPRIDISEIESPCFFGIDSGSTTTKMVIIDKQKRLAMDYYIANGGDPLDAARKGVIDFYERLCKAGINLEIARSAVTGYGESLIRAALGIDDGIVETMAHYRAAKSFEPHVTFILDIGGQDMKAIYIRNGAVADVQINEACSSGCGSFLETFAHSLNLDVATFAQLACEGSSPFDLGTRCTVFMNSRVKQALREGAAVSDISSGLAYAVIKNSLYKVLKLRDISMLGDHIVVQGGTFCNPAVLRAFELLLGREVVRPVMSHIMGAYGAALAAWNNYYVQGRSATTFEGLRTNSQQITANRRTFTCGGCTNSCNINELKFNTGRKYISGNRCERFITDDEPEKKCGKNLFAQKMKLLFERPLEPDELPLLTFGIPRVLNIYDNFPFWCTFLVACGFKVVLSDPSESKLFEKGVCTVMSDNVCFPGKLAHGHIIDLIEKKVDRIFYPSVVFDRQEFPSALNNYNCPIVTGYPDVIRSSVNPEGEFGIIMDSPVISFYDLKLLKKQLYAFVKPFGLSEKKAGSAADQALTAQLAYKSKLRELTTNTLRSAEASGNLVVVLAGRPYHLDPLINHGIPELLSRLGVDVIPEDGFTFQGNDPLTESNILTQWTYTNRIIAAAKYVASSRINGMVQLTSFGCGLDALSADEAKDILSCSHKTYSHIKIDEISNLGAVNIRLRAMIEAIKEMTPSSGTMTVKSVPVSIAENSIKTIITPWFSPYYSPFIPIVFQNFGFNLQILPPQERQSVEIGLQYVNNDMCYPAVILIGDVIKALKTGSYIPEETAILLTQTFGQCRASSYVPLLKKALSAVEFGRIPVLAIAAGDAGLQFSLETDRRQFVKSLSLGLIFSDALTKMVLAMKAHEIRPGDADALRNVFMAEITKMLTKGKFKPLLALLEETVRAFNKIEVSDRPIPTIGIVGEIFVKYNPFSNNNMVEWLISQGVEVVLPSLVNFFTQRFVNEEYNQISYLKRSLKDRVGSRLLDAYIHYYLCHVERIMAEFRYYRKNYDLHELAAEAGQVASLANQAGEGWLLTAEMVSMLRSGIDDIVCLQPFGCLANHITGKGIEKRMKAFYPNLNLHFLDMDAGVSEVNILNRLYFMLERAKDQKHNKAHIIAA